MSECIIIKPEDSLIERTIEFLRYSERDYSANIVLFPGRRPGHFLRKRLSELVRAPYIPPLVFSIDDFIDVLYEELFQKTGRKLTPIDAVYLLYQIYRKADYRPGREAFVSPELFLPLGIKMFKDFEELHIEGVSPEGLRNLEMAIPELVEKNIQCISDFYRDFYRKASEAGFSTRAMRYREVARGLTSLNSPDTTSFRKRALDEYNILVSGFYAFTRAEREIIQSLSEITDLHLIFTDGPGLKERLSEFSLPLKEPSTTKKAPPKITLYSSPDTHGQVLKTASILKALKEKGQRLSTDTLILLPSSDTLFPLLHNCLGIIQEEGFNISMGYPLYRTPIYSFFITLMELIENIYNEGIYVKDYLRFILHPYIKNIFFRGDDLGQFSANEITRILAHSIKSFFDEQVLNLFISLDEIEKREGIFSRFFDHLSEEIELGKEELMKHLRWIHENTIGTFREFQNVRDMAERAEKVLLFIYKNSTAPVHPYFHPYAEGFMRLFDELKNSLFADYSFSETANYFNFLKGYIKNASVAFEGTPLRGVQVLGLLETRGLRFRRVFALDVNEGVIPDGSREDTLLPHKIRQSLGLTTYKDREAIMEYYFNTLLEASEEAYIFSIDNNQQQRSRFVERLLWQWQRREKTTETERFLKKIQYRVNLQSPVPAPVKKTDEVLEFLKDHSFTPSSLDDYIDCGLRFYYQNVLKISSKSTTEKINLGILTHELLNQYFRPLLNRPLLREAISLKRVAPLVEGYFSQKYGQTLDGKTYLIKRQVKARIEDLLSRYFIPLCEKHRVVIGSLESELKARIGEFNIKGRIDRVEQRDEQLYIIDYKTTYTRTHLRIDLERLNPDERSSWSESVRSIQIPLYVILYTRVHSPQHPPRGLYLLLGRAGIDRDSIEFEPLVFTPETLNAVEGFVLRVLKEINSPEVPFLPPQDMKRSCPRCNYQEVCGTKWVKGSAY